MPEDLYTENRDSPRAPNAARRTPDSWRAGGAGRGTGDLGSAAQSLNPFRTLHRHRNFRYFWFGQTISLVGTWLQSVAQGWLALQLTNDAFVVGAVYASGSLPVALLSLYGGVIADRHSKLRLVVVAQALLLVQAALFWWLVRSGGVDVSWVIALALFGGVVNAFEIPARQSFIIELVGRDDLLDAIALNSSGFNLARIIGPMLAGLIIAKLGLAWCFGLNALSYLAVLAGLLAIRLPADARTRAAGVPAAVADIREGLAYVRRTGEVWVLLRLVAVYAVFGIPYLALMPVIARDTLRGDASTYGLLLSAVGTGAIAAALALAVASQRVRRGQLFAVGGIAFSLLVVAFTLSRTVWLSASLLFAVGFAMIVTNALANGLLQTLVPDALRGRVMAAYVWVFVGVGPFLGPNLAGALAKRVGAPNAVALTSVVTLLYAAWTFWRHPELRAL